MEVTSVGKVTKSASFLGNSFSNGFKTGTFKGH